MHNILRSLIFALKSANNLPLYREIMNIISLGRLSPPIEGDYEHDLSPNTEGDYEISGEIRG